MNQDGLHGVKVLELTDIVHRKSPDVVVATETELKTDDLPQIPGYSIMVPTVTNSSLVRSAMYVKNKLQAEQIPVPSDIQMVACRVGSTAIIGLYHQFRLITQTGPISGNTFEAQQFEEIESAIRTLSNDFKTLHICGDINLDPTRREDGVYYRRTLLKKWCALMDELGLKWAETGPTYKSHGLFSGEHKLSTIDLVYSRSAGVTEATVLPDGGTDHSPVYAVIKGTPDSRRLKRETRQDRNWQNMDSALLEYSLLDRDWEPLLSTSDSNEAVSLLKAAMSAAVDVSVPLRTYCTPNLGVRLKPDTRKVMKARNKAKREGSLHYKALRNKSLSLVRRDFVTHNLERIRRGGQEAAWKITGEVMGKQKTSLLPIPSQCTTDQQAADKCNTFYKEKVLKLRQDVNSQPIFKKKNLDIPMFSFHSVGTSIVRNALKKIKSKPACGVDKIPIIVYKSAQEALLLPLVHVVNLILKTGVWPEEWKQAIVTPTLKAGKPSSEVGSYRPVVNLCSVSKVVERIMHDQLVAYLDEHKLIPHQQHGFRCGRGVETALTALMSRVAEAQDRGFKVGLAAYDFSAAFDTISKTVLEEKMWWASEPTKTLISSYMSNRVQQVRWNTALSRVLSMDYGVPQGSVLAPLLFLIATGDLPEAVITGLDPSISAGVSQYADDSTGYAASKSWEGTETALSKMAANLETFSYDHGLHLNAAKTQKLKLGNVDTASTDTLNILGVKLDRHGGFAAHNAMVVCDLRKRLGAVRRLSVQLPRGKLLSEIGTTLIVGRLQSCAFVTRGMRLKQSGQDIDKGPAQVVLNDLARLLLGIRRADHHRVVDLIDRSKLPTVNEIVIRQSSVAAWKADRGGALHDVLESYDCRTRGSADNLKRPKSERCLAANNMARTWNSSEALRRATTLAEARLVAKKMAKEARHA